MVSNYVSVYTISSAVLWPLTRNKQQGVECDDLKCFENLDSHQYATHCMSLARPILIKASCSLDEKSIPMQPRILYIHLLMNLEVNAPAVSVGIWRLCDFMFTVFRLW